MRIDVVRTVAITACSMLAASFAFAEDDAGAPLQSQDQVRNALAQIAPAYAGKTRFVATGGPGSIEAAIAAHVPTVFHPVIEGVLAAPKPNAKCPSEMALSGGGRFCVDRYECAVDEK